MSSASQCLLRFDSLADDVLVIAGGSSGIGAACADIAMRYRLRVAIVGRDAERLHAEVTRHSRLGGGVRGFRADLSDPHSARLVMASVADTFGRIGAAIVSAGAASRVPFAALDDNCWHDALRAKFFPCVYAIQAALPHLERRGQGSLVAVVGSGGKNPDPDSLPASAANAALLCAVTGISRAVAPDIRLNSVNPGIIETPRYWRRVESEAARTSTSPEDVHARLSRRPFMQRLGQAAEVAKACLYLVSDESCGIRGAELAVDGGGRRG